MLQVIFSTIGILAGLGCFSFSVLCLVCANGKETVKIKSVRYVNCTAEEWELYEEQKANKKTTQQPIYSKAV